MSVKKNFTIETRLSLTNEQLEYFLKNTRKQERLFRIVWKMYQTKPKGMKDSALNTLLQQTHQIDKRTANTLIRGVKGRLKALKALKIVEKANLRLKISVIKKEIWKLNERINEIKPKVSTNLATEKQLEKYRKNKRAIWQKKQKLNRMKQSLEKLERQENQAIFPLCWGTKKLFKAQYYLNENNFNSHEAWINAYHKKRDSQFNFIGSTDEPNQNQNAQLTYDEDTGFFSLKVRKDLGLMKDETDKFFTLEHLNFKHHRQKLIETMKEAKTPITIRILRRENKWYMQVIFTWVSEPNTQVTKSEYGSIGLDFNDGFIEASEVDHYGNLVYQVHYKLKHHGTGNKAKSEMQVIAKKLSDYALEVMKPIVIEDLNFKKTKAKTSKNTTGKTYNKMLHAFDYSRYKKLLENVCHRKKLELIFVNPAYTSIIGERKFGNRMKLNRHQAASFVIARRGIGFVDNI